MCVSGYGADGTTIFAKYQEILQSETNAPATMKEVEEYLSSLSKDDFVAFIRETRRHTEYDRDDADVVVGMVFFAKWYKDGPGKNETLLLTLKQLSDATLPASWKIGLLNVLKPENRPDLNEEEVAAVISVLHETGRSKQNSDVFRTFCLQRLGNLLSTQREIITQKAPDLKDALEKEDRTVLPKKDDANVRKAAKLIDAIGDYKTALQKTADEVKDEQIKANLKKRLSKWEPTPNTPIK
jgi:hypothetical protein